MVDYIMRIKSRALCSLVAIAALFLLLQACASFEQASSEERTYDQSFEAVNETVEKSIRKTNLAILDVFESEDKVLITYRIGRSTTARGSGNSPVGTRNIDHEEGTVTVRELPGGMVRVSVENPDYHFTVPDDEKADYEQMLYQVLDQMNERQEPKSQR